MFDFLKRKKKADAAAALKPLPASSFKQSLLSLEQRLMFDAAAAATAAEVKSEQVAQDQAEAAVSTEASHETTGAETGESRDVLNALASYMPTESRTEVIFVDPTVPNYQELLAGMDPNAEIIMLDAGKDGVQQIADSLAGRTGVDAIHLISHGNAGELQLGTSHLTQESMTDRYASELAVIKGSLSEEADLLIYGCNFAEGEQGGRAATTLADLTGTDVSASVDLTGTASKGGDWDLEFKVGQIETSLAVGQAAQENWAAILAVHAVADTNNAPTDLSLSANTVAENATNGTTVGTVTGTDRDSGDTMIYSLTDTAGGRFAINSSTGQVTVADGSLLNYEVASSHNVTVRVTDSGGLTYDETFTINLTDVNEAPSITSDGGGATASVNVTENGTAVTTVVTRDPDAGQTLAYSIVGGSDAAKFAINSSTGVLSFLSAPNYEAPTDSGGNNVYDVTVQVSDGTFTDSQAISVSVSNANEAPLAAADRAALTFDGVDDFVNMGSGAVYEVTDTVTMEAWINREPSSQATQMILNKEGEYEVGLDADGSIKWAFANTNPGWTWHDTGVVIPVHTWTHIAVTYDHGTITTYVNGVAADTYAGSGTIGDAHPTKDTLRIGGRENNPANQYFNGQISEAQVWNVARTAGQIASDLNGTLTGAETGLLGYWKFNENSGGSADNLTANSDGTLGGGVGGQAPQWAIYRVNEDTTLSVSGSGVLANDYDVDGDTLSAIMVTGPSNASSFTLNSDGTFSYTPAANFSGTDSFTYQVSDGTNLSNIATVHIQVDPVNDRPTDLALSANTVAEDATTGIVVGTVTGTDPDAGDTHTYSLTDTAGGRFAINASTGVITVADGSLLNYEAATSHSVTVRTTDAGGLTHDQTLTIALTDVAETSPRQNLPGPLVPSVPTSGPGSRGPFSSSTGVPNEILGNGTRPPDDLRRSIEIRTEASLAVKVLSPEHASSRSGPIKSLGGTLENAEAEKLLERSSSWSGESGRAQGQTGMTPTRSGDGRQADGKESDQQSERLDVEATTDVALAVGMAGVVLQGGLLPKEKVTALGSRLRGNAALSPANQGNEPDGTKSDGEGSESRDGSESGEPRAS